MYPPPLKGTAYNGGPVARASWLADTAGPKPEALSLEPAQTEKGAAPFGTAPKSLTAAPFD
jgi:hypothetical protein